tara:strand:- start:19211 stop:20515 length:1305 start_codon:yes stop_codon:yes gene_type:complete
VFSKLRDIFSRQDLKLASIASVSIKFGGAFFAFVNGVLLARLLSVEGFGYYVLVVSTMMLLSVPVMAGIPNLITRYVAKYRVSKDEGAIKGLLIKTNQYALLATGGIYVIALLLYFLWWNQYDSALVEAMTIGFLMIPFLGLNALRSGALRGLKLLVMSELPDTLFRNFVIFLSILFCVLFNIELTPLLAVWFQVGVAFLSFLLGAYFLHKKLWNSLRPVSPVFRNKEWIQQTIPFSINSGIQVIKSRVLTYVILIFGTVEGVALFEVALRGANLVAFTLDALNRAISPFIATAFEEKNMQRLQKIITKATRLIFATSLPVALVFILGGESLITFIFGEAYVDSYIPLVIICIGQLVNAMTGSVGLLLNMTGNQHVFSKSNMLFLAINIALSIPAVLYFQVTGAAMAYTVILALQNITLVWYVKKHLNINTAIV